jgi:hypothetical protein
MSGEQRLNLHELSLLIEPSGQAERQPSRFGECVASLLIRPANLSLFVRREDAFNLPYVIKVMTGKHPHDVLHRF